MNVCCSQKIWQCKDKIKKCMKKRVKLLLLHFDTSLLFPKVFTLNAEYNITKIVQCYLKDETSATEHISCNKCKKKKTRYPPTIILPLNFNIEQIQNLLNE
jgi:hypothetical protein